MKGRFPHGRRTRSRPPQKPAPPHKSAPPHKPAPPDKSAPPRKFSRENDVRAHVRESGAHTYDRESGARAYDRDASRAHVRDDLVFGIEPIRELAAAAPAAVRTLYIRRGIRNRFAREIDLVAAAGGRTAEVDDAELIRLAGAQAIHQGAVALIKPFSYAAIEDVIAARPDPILLVDGVTDPRNLGALLRSAEGAGAGAVVIAKDRTARLTPAAIKASAGAWVHLKIAECGNVARALEDLKEAGYWIAAMAPGGDRTIYDLDPSMRLAVVAGSEGAGVREIVKKRADFVVKIPMRGKIGSLNVAVAAAVTLFEIARAKAARAAG
ncbi:MAG: 23S rRNA (guanosine(2251)-2'-O)-methyltransferase RlmB [Candidatus Binataceae bacterium]